MKEPNYHTDYEVPGTEFVVCSHFMDGSDRDGTKYALEFVLEHCGEAAARKTMEEIKRRMREKQALIGAFFAVHSASGGDIDAALRAALANKNN